MIKNKKLMMAQNQQNWNKIMDLLSKCAPEAEVVFQKELDILNREYVKLTEGENGCNHSKEL